MSTESYWTEDPSKLLRVESGFKLVDVADRRASRVRRQQGRRAGRSAEGAVVLADLQERLFAHHQTGDDGRRILLVLQAMDTAGKGGIVKHVIGAVDPQGVQLAAFKAPTDEELAHDFLWRVRKEVPEAGQDRRLRPVALRGRAHRARARARAARGDRAALRRDQRVRGRARRRRAPRSSR